MLQVKIVNYEMCFGSQCQNDFLIACCKVDTGMYTMGRNKYLVKTFEFTHLYSHTIMTSQLSSAGLTKNSFSHADRTLTWGVYYTLSILHMLVKANNSNVAWLLTCILYEHYYLVPVENWIKKLNINMPFILVTVGVPMLFIILVLYNSVDVFNVMQYRRC